MSILRRKRESAAIFSNIVYQSTVGETRDKFPDGLIVFQLFRRTNIRLKIGIKKPIR